MILLGIFLIALLIYFIFFVSQFYNFIIKGNAPFISTDEETLGQIIDAAQLHEQSVVYELGCGQARFLRIVEKIFPQTTLIGVENLLSVWLVTKIKVMVQRSSIQVLKQNIFTVSLKTADVIYCYLNNATMQKLSDKFTSECKPGTQIISRSFPIPQFEPAKVLLIKGKKVFFYTV